MAENPMPTIDQMLCFAVYSASHAFTRFYKPRLDALDLTYPQYLVFLVLWERDGLTVKALGDKLFLDSGTITLLVAWAATKAPKPELLHASNVTGGLLVVCAVLLVFEVRKVQIGNYLPALVAAPLLAWLFF